MLSLYRIFFLSHLMLRVIIVELLQKQRLKLHHNFFLIVLARLPIVLISTAGHLFLISSMHDFQTLRNNRGSIFVLVLVVTFLAVMLGYLLFQTNTNLYKASEEQTIQGVLERNMNTKAERAFALSASLNTNGS